MLPPGFFLASFGNLRDVEIMGLLGAGVECGSVHTGGAKSIRLDD
jgi:hypothetical protein